MTDDTIVSHSGGEPPKGRADRGELTPADKALRDAAIIASLHAGMAVRDVAREFELTPRSVERIVHGFDHRVTAIDRAPMEIVERVLRTYEMQMRNFAMVAHDTLGRAPAVSISALKAQADALERYTRLLADIGKLPRQLETFRDAEELGRAAQMMAQKLGEAARGECSASDAQEFFTRLLQRREDVWDAEALELPPGDEEAA